MSKKIPVWLVALLLCLSVIITFQVTYISQYNKFRSDSEKNADEFSDKIKTLRDIYDTYYVGDVDEEQLEYYAMNGLIWGMGDKYGEYMSAETYDAFMSDLQGENQGIGISVIFSNEDLCFEIISVSKDSPADKAGVQTGDYIVRVYGEEVSELGYSASLTKMQGEAGTTAEFTILRGTEYIDFSVERGYIATDTVDYHMNSDGITGIIRITNFDTTTPDSFNEATEALISQGAQRFVFDVRNNPGGELNSITTVLDKLLPEGPIIRIINRDGEEKTMDSDAEELNYPMAVLVNGSTASAAELFTGALKDYKKAVIVGTNTYGKGTMQSIIPLYDGSAVRVSNATYNPPFSDNYEGIGIKPDVEIELSGEAADMNFYKITDDIDTQLTAAIEYLNNN